MEGGGGGLKLDWLCSFSFLFTVALSPTLVTVPSRGTFCWISCWSYRCTEVKPWAASSPCQTEGTQTAERLRQPQSQAACSAPLLRHQPHSCQWFPINSSEHKLSGVRQTWLQSNFNTHVRVSPHSSRGFVYCKRQQRCSIESREQTNQRDL